MRAALLPLAFLPVLATSTRAQEVRTVDVDGRQVRVRTAGLESADSRRPVVVFEAGFMYDGLSAWTSVLHEVAEFAPVVAYDRAGIGGSEPDGVAPTPRHIARNLHRLLGALGAEPPYVLVGHSLGGPLVRMFTELYPTEVRGIVYIDPMYTTSEEERGEVERAMGLSAASRPAIEALVREQLPGMPSASIRAEAEMILGEVALQRYDSPLCESEKLWTVQFTQPAEDARAEDLSLQPILRSLCDPVHLALRTDE
jgi:pimeloyl-ACP methyl ester carboxylesterase